MLKILCLTHIQEFLHFCKIKADKYVLTRQEQDFAILLLLQLDSFIWENVDGTWCKKKSGSSASWC